MFTLTNRVTAIGLKNGKHFNTKNSFDIVVKYYRSASVKLTPHDVNILKNTISFHFDDEFQFQFQFFE